MFNETVFGPIHSRRLGVSLGINLLPNDGKVCSFDCLYCEAGYNSQGAGTTGYPSVDAVARDLEAKLRDLKAAGEPLDVITFSGNGEPTLHPHFGEIVDLTARLRDSYYPEARLSVLTNATTLSTRDDVVDALRRVDNPIVKLDSAIPATLALLDRPGNPGYDPRRAIDGIKRLDGDCIIQTMILRGTAPDGTPVDNTTPAEVDALIAAITEIAPRGVMLYSIDRPTPCKTLSAVGRDELAAIARKMQAAGIKNVTVN